MCTVSLLGIRCYTLPLKWGALILDSKFAIVPPLRARSPFFIVRSDEKKLFWHQSPFSQLNRSVLQALEKIYGVQTTCQRSFPRHGDSWIEIFSRLLPFRKGTWILLSCEKCIWVKLSARGLEIYDLCIDLDQSQPLISKGRPSSWTVSRPIRSQHSSFLSVVLNCDGS